MDKGLIHIYCGDGKGKTTAAIGLGVRACGAGFKVFIVQFIKSWKTNELIALEKFEDIKVIRGDMPSGFTWQLNDEQKIEMTKEHNRIFEEAIKLCGDGNKVLLVLDELIGAYHYNFIDRQMVIDFLKNKPSMLEVVMTGRNPKDELIELADYVSEVKKIKHPYDKGIIARNGIER